MGVYNRIPQISRAFIGDVGENVGPAVNVNGDLLQWNGATEKWERLSLAAGFVPNTRKIDTTEGVQGGGDLSVDRTHKLDINGLTEDTAPDGDTDYIATYDSSGAVHKKSLIDVLIRAGRLAVRFVTGDYTIVSTDDIILADASSGSLTVTLPSVLVNKGRPIFVKRISEGENLVFVSGGTI